MKKITFLLIISVVFITAALHAQWSTDPENPGVVCNVTDTQNSLYSFADGNGGVYAFWLDNRLGNPGAQEIYGQHYDAEGYTLWENDGRLIFSHTNKINWFRVNRFSDGEIIFGWVAHHDGVDSLKIQRLDEDGSFMWASDLAVANTAGDPTYILGLGGYSIIKTSSGYCIAMGITYYGGSNGNRVTWFTSEGTLTGAYYGQPIGAQNNYGSSGLLSAYNTSDDAYLFYSTGNGLGAGLMCCKFTTNGTVVWGPLNVISGSNGLGYQFSAISDENGITFLWIGTGADGGGTNLYARRVNTDGTPGWGGNTTAICIADGTQDNFFWNKNGGNYYITWADGRPGTSPGYYDIYAQKLDMDGNTLWTENGVLAISLNTYIPYPKFSLTTDKSMIICHQSNIMGFVAQKVLDDGTVAWDEDGNLICINSFNPNYYEHIEILTGDKVIAVWVKSNPSGGSDGIYITRVDDEETTGHVKKEITQLSIYPNPAKDNFKIILPYNSNDAEISIYDLQGKEIKHFRADTSPVEVSCELLNPGIYFVSVQNGEYVFSGKLNVVK